jgi:hypothetical integral membrane protein (TIGR02206 family)
MPPERPSLFLSADHLAVVALTIVTLVVSCRAARRDPSAPWIPWFLRALAALQILNAVWTQIYFIRAGRWSLATTLPFQLCDAAIVATVVALLRPSPLAFELTYFWGLAATFQGIVTPAISDRFPHPVFLQFFALHAGIVVAAVFLAVGLRFRPRPHAVLRMMLWTNAVAVVAGVVCWLTGGNYMFLREPPPTGSLLDLLGPWPWYLAAAEVVAFLAFLLLALPFTPRPGRETPGLAA